MAIPTKITVIIENAQGKKAFVLTEGKATKTYLKFNPAPDCKDLAPFSTIYIGKPTTKAKGKAKPKAKPKAS